MASINRQYQHGKSFPISSLTSNPQILEFADRLYSQAMKMEQANENGRHFDYKPILVPQNLRHIFGD
ncbi:MAG: hypothetical protein WCK93_10940 [Nitrosomonadales bacterium]